MDLVIQPKKKKKKLKRNGLEHTNLSCPKEIEKSRSIKYIITHSLYKSVTQVSYIYIYIYMSNGQIPSLTKIYSDLSLFAKH